MYLKWDAYSKTNSRYDMYTLSYFLTVMRRLIDFAALKFPGGHGGKP